MSRDATGEVRRAIAASFTHFPGFEMEEVGSRSWASATFTGARHEISFRLEGKDANAAADAFLETLEAAEFTLRRHLLADIALVSQERSGDAVRIRLEALTVEDA